MLSLFLVLMACQTEPDILAIDDTGDALSGASLYASECARCHAADGTGDRAPDLTDVAADMAVDDVVDVILNGEGRMRARDVTEDEAFAIAEYVLDVIVDGQPASQ